MGSTASSCPVAALVTRLQAWSSVRVMRRAFPRARVGIRCPGQTSHGPGLSSSVLLILAVVSPGGVLVVAGAGLEAAVEAADEAVRIIAKANVA